MIFTDLPTHTMHLYQWSAETPIFMPAGLAFDLLTQDIERTPYFLPMWMDDMMGGFRAFIFADNNQVGMSELHILLRDQYDEKFDQLYIISSHEAIYAPNLDIPEQLRNQCHYP